MQQQLTDTYILLGFLPSLSCFPHTLPSLPREASVISYVHRNPHLLPANQPTYPYRIYAVFTAYAWRGEELFPHSLTISFAIKLLKLKCCHELDMTRGLLDSKEDYTMRSVCQSYRHVTHVALLLQFLVPPLIPALLHRLGLCLLHLSKSLSFPRSYLPPPPLPTGSIF